MSRLTHRVVTHESDSGQQPLKFATFCYYLPLTVKRLCNFCHGGVTPESKALGGLSETNVIALVIGYGEIAAGRD